MNTHSKLLSSLTASALLAFGFFSAPANATYHGAKPQTHYTPCPEVKKELMAKVKRLKKLAYERECAGDAYGARRLRNTAHIIMAHIGNLPCVNSHTCPL